MGQVLGVPDTDESTRPVAVIVPACNESENLPATLARIPRDDRPDLKVIVVDDGSTDGTAEIAHRHGADVVVSHKHNRGLGAALRTGLATANELDARAAVYLDADGEYPPEQIPDLLAPIEAGEADYVLGSRYLEHSPDQRAFRRIGNMAFTAALNLAAGRRITDGQTRVPRLLPPRAGVRRDHPRLQLRPGADPRPAEDGYAAAGSSRLVPAAHQGQFIHRAQVSLARPHRGCCARC